jgi:hypothetical protein
MERDLSTRLYDDISSLVASRVEAIFSEVVARGGQPRYVWTAIVSRRMVPGTYCAVLLILGERQTQPCNWTG